jgi:hypothetical protein
MKKWAHELYREFSKEEVQMANKYIKKCSTSLAIKKMKIKSTLIFQLIPIIMAIYKRETIANAGRETEKQELLYIIDGNASYYHHYGKQYGNSSKTDI